jgi:hypothetical protein
MSEATASQLGLMMESGSADMPPEGLKGANGSPIRVVGSARVPLVWGGTVETFVFYICEELVYPLVGYLALKGRNDWGHVDGRTTRLFLSGVEFVPDGEAYRAKVLTARQLAGLANLPTANEPDLDSKWLRPPDSTVGEIPVRIVKDRVPTYAETDAVVAAMGAATPKKVRWADMPSPMTVVQRHADDDIVGFVRNEAPTTYVHVVTGGATLGVTKAGDGIECHLDPDLAADMTAAQHERLADILTAMAENTKKVLTSPPKDQGAYNFRIRLRPGEEGAFEPRRRMNEHQAKLAYQLFDELSATGRMIAMEAREARHIMNLTFPAKKDGSLRPCIDSRLLNKKLVVEPVNVPSVREVRDQMDPKAKVFAIVDLANGFNLLPVTKESIPYCCVWGPKGEVWAYTVMTFGYTTAPQHFRDFTDFVLRGLPHTYTYVDDVSLDAHTPDGILDRLEELGRRLEEHGAGAHPRKVWVGYQVPCLGAIRTRAGFVPDPEKTRAIDQMSTPSNQTELRSALGMFRYLGEHMDGLSVTLASLNALTSNKHAATFDADEQAAIAKVLAKAKEHVRGAVALAVPDWELPFILHCDASDAGVGGYLAQMGPEGTERAIRFFHKAFAGSMVNWSTFSKEAYAVIYALEQCAPYLAGRHFKVVTDHKPLIWVYRAARKLQGPSRVYSWAVLLDSFDFEIEHIPGTKNLVADALSRPPFLPPAAKRSGGGDRDGDEIVAPVHDQPADHAREEFFFFPPHVYDPAFPGDAFEQAVRQVWGGAKLEDLQISAEVAADVKDHIKELEEFHGRLRYKPTGAFYIPIHDWDRTMWMLHNSPTGGHFGAEKVLSLLEGKGWRPRMAMMVREHCKLCGLCQRNKPQPALTGPQNALPSVGVWERVHVDLIEMPESTKGNRHVLQVVDSCSKKLFAFAIPDKSAATVCGRLLALFQDVGFPWSLTSDQGKEFANKMLESIEAQFGIVPHQSTAYHHQSNGQVEVMNRVLETTLRMHVARDQKDWDTWLDECVVAMNSARPLNGAPAPDTVWFGRLKRGPLDLLVGSNPPKGESGYAAWVHIQRLRELTATLEGTARAATAVGAEPSITVGDLVLVKFRKHGKGKSKKLAPRQQGPYRVMEVEHGNVAKLTHVENPNDTLSRHVSDLVRYRGQPDEVEADDEFEVEKIVAERNEGEVTEYRVRFAGYAPNRDQWMTERALVNAPAVVTAWKNRDPTNDKVNVDRVVNYKDGRWQVAVDSDQGPEDYIWIGLDEAMDARPLLVFKAMLEAVRKDAKQKPKLKKNEPESVGKPKKVDVRTELGTRVSARATKGRRSDSKYADSVSSVELWGGDCSCDSANPGQNSVLDLRSKQFALNK